MKKTDDGTQVNPIVAKQENSADPVASTKGAGEKPEEINPDSGKLEKSDLNESIENSSRVLGIKVITDDDVETQEASILEPLSFISENGDEYQITVPKFRFKGQEYDSQKAIEKTPEVLEILIEAESFFIQKRINPLNSK